VDKEGPRRLAGVRVRRPTHYERVQWLTLPLAVAVDDCARAGPHWVLLDGVG
jgi:hypothetical protein